MRIEFAGRVLTQANGRTDPGPIDFRWGSSYVADVRPLTRSTAVKILPRKNQSHTLAFSLPIPKSSTYECLIYAANQKLDLAGLQGTLRLHPSTAAGGVGIIDCLNAVLVSHEATYIGVVAVINYTFVFETLEEG